VNFAKIDANLEITGTLKAETCLALNCMFFKRVEKELKYSSLSWWTGGFRRIRIDWNNTSIKTCSRY